MVFRTALNTTDVIWKVTKMRGLPPTFQILYLLIWSRAITIFLGNQQEHIWYLRTCPLGLKNWILYLPLLSLTWLNSALHSLTQRYFLPRVYHSINLSSVVQYMVLTFSVHSSIQSTNNFHVPLWFQAIGKQTSTESLGLCPPRLLTAFKQ